MAHSKVGRVDKTWGHENIVISTDKYCLKYLIFDKAGGKTSMHFHQKKHETWKVVIGEFTLRTLNTKDGSVTEQVLKEEDTWEIDPMEPHQLEALKDDCMILEVSTRDDPKDNHRLYR
jgi:mannose-6-phosphate isomerase-like protein (cupin superfamily)